MLGYRLSNSQGSIEEQMVGASSIELKGYTVVLSIPMWVVV